MNPFDAAITGIAIVVIVIGFMAGLLRSLATIVGWLVAAPLAFALTPLIAPFAFGKLPPDRAWMVLCGAFFVAGGVLGTLFGNAVREYVGEDAGLFDRVAGAALAAVRIFLIAVLIVVVFDRIIPVDREPSFLKGSRLRP